MTCVCSLAGTAACASCSNNPNSAKQYSNFITWTNSAERTCHFSLVVDQDPSRKHRGNIYECSVCGTRYAWGFIVDERLNYCPNCGAKVVGE